MTAEKLRELGGAYWDEGGGKVLYLTFDAGYENGFTEEILDVLQELQVPAAFFLTGDYLNREPDLVRRMTAEGHIVGNHTMTHPDMSAIREKEAFQKELEGLETLFKEVTGKDLPKYYRPPQGIYSEDNLKMAKELGYKTVFWSLAYADWDEKHQMSPEAAINKLMSRMHNGAVILLHPTSSTNAKIMPELIRRLKAEGYEFGTLDEI
jgi:peptidoglycan-N-acetylmuramic acid deacetylase